MTPQQEAQIIHNMRRAIAIYVDGEDARANELTDVELCYIASAIIPLIWNPATAAERERCAKGVEAEAAYIRATYGYPQCTPAQAYALNKLDEAAAAIRALPSMEADDGR
jgi:hypothetical protein